MIESVLPHDFSTKNSNLIQSSDTISIAHAARHKVATTQNMQNRSPGSTTQQSSLQISSLTANNAGTSNFGQFNATNGPLANLSNSDEDEDEDEDEDNDELDNNSQGSTEGFTAIAEGYQDAIEDRLLQAININMQEPDEEDLRSHSIILQMGLLTELQIPHPPENYIPPTPRLAEEKFHLKM